jgi:hypothetical protein
VNVRSVLKQLLGTLVAVIGGWCAGVAMTALIAFTGMGGAQPEAAVGATLYSAVFMWIWIVPVWIVVLIPLYLFIPRSSWLWHPVACTLLGALGGIGSAAVSTHGNFDPGMLTFYLVAMAVGGATCLTGAVTRNRFKT